MERSDDFPLVALRCVVVEDQVMFLQLLVAMLRNLPGLEVVATAQGLDDGMAACDEHRPDLVILDLALPDGYGVELMAALAEREQPPRVIVLSGQVSSFVCPRQLRPLVQAVVDKTRAYDDLRSEVQRLLHPQGDQAGNAEARGRLTARERQVFALIGKGWTNRLIAEQLGLSLRTVETHRKNITGKVGAKGGELVRLAALDLQMTLDRVD
ncbi:MAG: response regulator transcription factor [Prochlorococcaceae cyanobacterium]